MVWVKKYSLFTNLTSYLQKHEFKFGLRTDLKAIAWVWWSYLSSRF